MIRRTLIRCVALPAFLATLAGAAEAQDTPAEIWSMAATFRVETLTDELSYPWSLAVLPGGDMLVTEKFNGTLRRVAADGTVGPSIAGVPAVYASENGGLLGIALDPDFPRNGRVYLAYAEQAGGGDAGLAVARARLAGDRLEDLAVIFRQTPKVPGDQNFGGRILFAPDGTLFVFAGNRFAPDAVKDPASSVGTIVRIRPDGSVPPDNPFVGIEGANPAVWSRGHRNPGAAAFHPDTGQLFVAEFGPWGGDELNLPHPGSNHGWPHVSWGRPYGGGDIPDPPTRPEFDREIFFWSPTIGPSGALFHDGSLVPAWEGSLLLGGLTSRSLVRLTVEGDRVLSEERLRLGARIRDVVQAADGALLLLTDEENGRILRLVPRTLDGQR
jgi:glucose/arabinose dehydrogenase